MILKRKRDPRINTGYISIKEYVLVFLAFTAFNRLLAFVHYNFIASDDAPMKFALDQSMIFVMVASTIVTAVIIFVRRTAWNRPIEKLSDATREIAKGDFSVRIAPLRKDGKKDHVEVMFDDFNAMAQELQSIEILKNDFIANVSHEIKTPLAVIQNYATAILDDNLKPQERREYVATILDASRKLSALVTNILKLNKLENMEILPQAHPFDLSEQLRRCAVAFEDSWESKNINFEAEFEDDITVCLDESILEIIWNNLLSNAVKFTPPHGSIFVKSSQKDGVVRVSISNTGAGFSEETRKHIFDKFYQADASRHQEGNGLGLALVKRALDLSGAKIEVESKSGEGATFTVVIENHPQNNI